MKKTLIYALAMVATTSTAVALAENNGGNEGEGKDHPHGPPIEALKACEGKSVGTKVRFTTRNDRTLDAVCQLIAVPEHLPGAGGGQGGQNNQGGQQQVQGAKQ